MIDEQIESVPKTLGTQETTVHVSLLDSQRFDWPGDNQPTFSAALVPGSESTQRLIAAPTLVS